LRRSYFGSVSTGVADAFQNFLICRRSATRLRGDPGAQLVRGLVDGWKGRAAQIVMHQGGGESVAGPDGVGDIDFEPRMFVATST
jgi:hypothetical protein